jgi:hypothetical protein
LIRTDFEELFDQVVDSYSVRVPTYVHVSKKNQKAVNLNVYRNLHHHHLNTQKKNFADEVKPLLRDKPRAERVWIHYTIFAPRNGRLDTMNVGSITDKYFSDTMVEAGKIPDDNMDHIVLSTFSFGGVVPMDGHAIATVNILKESEDMRIILDQEDIQNALNAYVKTLNFPNAEQAEVDLSVEDDEIVAEVIMGEAKPKNKGGRPRKTTTTRKTPTKKEDTDVESTDSGSDEGSGSDADSGGSAETEGESEAGTKDTADEAKPDTEAKGKTSKGNLFGDEDEQSSDSAKAEGDSPKPKTVVKPTKKSSIFDVD